MLGGILPEGLIQGVEYFLFVFGITEITAQYKKLKLEYKQLTKHILPESENWVLTGDDIKELKLNIQKSYKNDESYLIDLINKSCTKYALSKSSSDVQALVDSQVEIYQNELESEQSFIKYSVWAIPSIGFIGTVLGISESLGFTKDIASGGGLEKVTTALAVAFDTTLIALLLSVVLMFVVHVLQKSEDTFFMKIKKYVIENFINRLYK
jgi:chemotaxis protein MotA